MSALEEPYRSRAMPPGSTRYWSWLFAARSARAPLLGLYALTAEWHALTDPDVELAVAQVKLAWWREELDRLIAGSPLHPITRYLAALPEAAAANFKPLGRSVEAAAAQVAGAPLERAAELQAHANALLGVPLYLASLLGALDCDRLALESCANALASAQYLSRAVRDYRRQARSGRIPFAIDDLLAAGIENDDLVAAAAPPRLQGYLGAQRRAATAYFSDADAALPPTDRPALRHLPVLAALGKRRLTRPERGTGAGADFRLADLYNAWITARRATRRQR